MIKFFRKIRRQLLTENRFSKYLIYAIGEIVLVVIGILIALQVNVMNNNRSLERTKQIYYKQILGDLERDISFIKYVTVGLDSTKVLYDSFFKSLDKPNLSKDIIIFNLSELSPINYLLKFENNTVETLENTGEIKLIPFAIRRKLLDFKQKQNRVVRVNEGNAKSAVNLLDEMNMIMGGFFDNLYAKQSKQPFLAKYYSDEEFKSELIMKSMAFYSQKSYNEKFILNKFEEMLHDIDTIIKLIKEEQNK